MGSTPCPDSHRLSPSPLRLDGATPEGSESSYRPSSNDSDGPVVFRPRYSDYRYWLAAAYDDERAGARDTFADGYAAASEIAARFFEDYGLFRGANNEELEVELECTEPPLTESDGVTPRVEHLHPSHRRRHRMMRPAQRLRLLAAAASPHRVTWSSDEDADDERTRAGISPWMD